jgi:hypothetical protein
MGHIPLHAALEMCVEKPGFFRRRRQRGFVNRKGLILALAGNTIQTPIMVSLARSLVSPVIFAPGPIQLVHFASRAQPWATDGSPEQLGDPMSPETAKTQLITKWRECRTADNETTPTNFKDRSGM